MNNSIADILSHQPQYVATSVQLLLLITVLSLAPSILILMTSFTRIVIVLSFVRTSLSTQQTPPNQVLIGLALFLTMFIMAPVFSQVNHDALKPYLKGQISEKEAMARAEDPFKEFMAKQTRKKDLNLFLEFGHLREPKTVKDIPMTALVPAYTISELKTAFEMGFMIFIPFLVIDMVVASVLMAMGMMMLPPVIISLPFKILLFIMVDGWYLVVQSLLIGYS
ncbi:flagellar biosynthetic protein FliP [Scopulibacillus daqui]|uniref:Flagellar biosynthetic protein FliP n=1 Tax=Scopulibacillus daqui TaxID=1469162 RepID=A0ABS2PWC4_9BACL|nr:flagellar type III secretion system pore protein FliP [Scopulibacillus daqui]MBM7644368.1 flagellar biosynthetic protein FliP [Scopulibacillus daqui]